jgi:hypothetical protein
MEPKHEKKLQKAREEQYEAGGDYGEKKPSLIQKILHPHGHGKDDKEERRSGEHVRDDRISQDLSRLSVEGDREHSHPKTTVDEKGHTKLHKDPPPHHPAAQAQAGVAGPDWDAVNEASRTPQLKRGEHNA